MKLLSRINWPRLCRTLAVVLLVACVFFAATDAWACPTCKEGIAENDPNSQAMARGYFYSILFMMAMPFTLLGTLGGAAYFSIRKAQAAKAAE